MPSTYQNQQLGAVPSNSASAMNPYEQKRRLTEDRPVYEDEFLRISSLITKPLVEVDGKLKLRVHVTTVNKTSTPINYYHPRYFGPKSSPE